MTCTTCSAPSAWACGKPLPQDTEVQVVETHTAQEKVKDGLGRGNICLALLKRKQEATGGDAGPQKVPQKRKTG